MGSADTIMLATLLSYIDRQVLAVLSPTILHDTGLSATDYANAISAFSIAYMIGNPLWGSFLDYVGLRLGMLMAVGLWTAASTSHAWVTGFVGFAVARAVLGFGEGAAFPGAMRTAAESLPPSQVSRGMALGLQRRFARRAHHAADRHADRAAIRLANRIPDHRRCLERSGSCCGLRLRGRRSCKRANRGALKIIWPNLLERRFWVVAASFGLGAVALGIVAYLSPLYLSRALGLTQAEIGKVVWIPMVGWEAGYFFWGWIADRYLDRYARQDAGPL